MGPIELPACCRGCEPDPSDSVVLATVRTAHRRPGLALTELRELYRAAAVSSLELLAHRDALGEESTGRYGDAFRLILRIEAR